MAAGVAVSVRHMERDGSVGRWTSVSRRASAVAFYVYRRARVELTTTETLRVSRLAYTSADGYFLEHHGELLPPGTTGLWLETGVYHFKSVRDVRVRIDDPDAVRVVTPDGVVDLDPVASVDAAAVRDGSR